MRLVPVLFTILVRLQGDHRRDGTDFKNQKQVQATKTDAPRPPPRKSPWMMLPTSKTRNSSKRQKPTRRSARNTRYGQDQGGIRKAKSNPKKISRFNKQAQRAPLLDRPTSSTQPAARRNRRKQEHHRTVNSTRTNSKIEPKKGSR